MNGTGGNQGLIGQIPSTIGVPSQLLIFAGIAILVLLIGAFSVALAFALFVLGLLAAVIIDFMMWQRQEQGSSSGGSATLSGSGGPEA